MLPNHQTLLVGLELAPSLGALSEGSKKAVQRAIWLAGLKGNPLLLMHSTYRDDYRTPLSGTTFVVHEGLPSSGRKALEAALSQVRAEGLDAELVITEERPWLEMCRLAVRDEVGLVLVGKRNAPAEDGRRLGSTAVKLLRKCPCPVWVLNPAHALTHQRILAATDLSEVGDCSVVIGWQLSQAMGCQLHVVHAWQRPMDLELSAARMGADDYARNIDQLEQKARTHIQELLPEDARKSLPVHLSMGSPAGVIRHAVSELQPDLLVMGTVSRSGLAGLLIGSTAERMLDRVDCSILALKPAGFESPIPG